MNLYFMRHGQAEDPTGNQTDFDRALTPKGLRRTEASGRAMANFGMPITKVLSSPRIRARQTAEIMAQALDKPLEISDLLDFQFSVQAIDQLLTQLSPEDDILFVGHEPSMSTTVEAITQARVKMKKGSIACVNLYPGTPLRGTLEWLIPPRLFDTLDQ